MHFGDLKLTTRRVDNVGFNKHVLITPVIHDGISGFTDAEVERYVCDAASVAVECYRDEGFDTEYRVQKMGSSYTVVLTVNEEDWFVVAVIQTC